MPTLSLRWMDQRTLSPGEEMPLIEALDVGDYNSVDIVFTVVKEATGTAPALVLEHAPCNELGGYLGFDPVQTVDLTMPGKTWIHLDRLTRFLGWSLTGALEDGATITADVVARR